MPSHVPPLHLLRLALWGETDDATREASAHAAACAACAAEVRDAARMRDLVRAVEGAGPSAAVHAAVVRRVRERAGATPPSGPDLTWLPAVGVGSFAGVRSVDAPDRLLRFDDGALRLDVAAQSPGAVRRATNNRLWTITGQVVLGGSAPGADLVVTLFLDRRPVDAVRTDRYGEFSLATHGAGRVGVSVAGHGPHRHVELWTGRRPAPEDDAS